MNLIFSLLLFSFFLLLLQTSTSKAHQPNIIQATCKNCSLGDPNVNYTLCINSFNSIPEAHNSTLRGLGVVATKLTLSNAITIRTEIEKRLRSSNKMKPYVRSCLETCLELYSGSISGLKHSMAMIKTERYDDANVALSTVVDAPDTCEDEFGDGGVESPLTRENDEFFQHSVIALSVVAMLQGHGHFGH